jgi:uncharacterized protein
MKIAILSDIHDHVWNLKRALPLMQDADAILCCGDLCSPFIVRLLGEGFQRGPVHIIFGNNDGDAFRIDLVADRFDHIYLHGELFQADVDGKRFAASHYDNIAAQLARSGQFDVVCYGHNHHFHVEQQGQTLMINPGTLMGYDPTSGEDIAATFVVYDTSTGEAERREISRSTQESKQ